MPPQFENNNVPPTNLENHHRDPSILIILIIVMLLSGAGAIWYILNLPPEPEPEIQPIVKTDQFADWQTYRNEEYGFEIKHPKEWYLSEIGGGVTIYERVVGPDLPGVDRHMQIYRGESFAPDYIDSFYSLVEKQETYTKVDEKQASQIYLKITNKLGIPDCIGPAPEDCEKIRSESIGVESVIINTYIPYISGTYVIRAEMGGEAGPDDLKKKIDTTKEKEYLDMYNKILSTFKFTK